MTPKDLLLILIVVFVWGTNFVAIRWGLDEMPPFFFASLRFFMVAFPFVFFIPKPKLEWWKILGVGLFVSTGQFSLMFLAIELGLRAGLASLIMQAQVIFTIILSFFVFKERLGRFEIAGTAIAFSGFGIFLWLRWAQGVPLFPFLLAIMAAFSWAWGNLIFKVAGNANRFHLTIWSALVPAFILLGLSLLIEGTDIIAKLSVITFKGWASLGYNAYLSTILAYSFWAILLGKFSAGRVTPFALLIPVFGLLSAWALLGETMTLREGFASLLIAGGIYIIVDNKRIMRLIGKRRKPDEPST